MAVLCPGIFFNTRIQPHATSGSSIGFENLDYLQSIENNCKIFDYFDRQVENIRMIHREFLVEEIDDDMSYFDIDDEEVFD